MLAKIHFKTNLCCVCIICRLMCFMTSGSFYCGFPCNSDWDSSCPVSDSISWPIQCTLGVPTLHLIWGPHKSDDCIKALAERPAKKRVIWIGITILLQLERDTGRESARGMCLWTMSVKKDMKLFFVKDFKVCLLGGLLWIEGWWRLCPEFLSLKLWWWSIYAIFYGILGLLVLLLLGNAPDPFQTIVTGFFVMHWIK